MLHRSDLLSHSTTVDQRYPSSLQSIHASKRSLISILSVLTALLIIAGLALFIIGGLKRTHAAPLVPAGQFPKVGINFNAPGAAGDRIFADAMKSGRPNWDSAASPGDGKGPATDANGWPTGDASNMVWEGISNNDGTYQLIFNGQATLSTSFGYGTFSNQQYDPNTNTTTATMVVTDTSAENFSLIFTNTKRTANSATNTGVTNVKLMRPTSEGATTSYSPSVTFTDQYKAAIAPYNHIRFMAGTNWNTSVNWSDRTRPFDFNQRKTLSGESGFEGNNIAYEYMVQLCNETNKDCYFNIPHKVNDDYVTKLAQLILYGSDGVNPYTSPQSNPVFAPLNSNLNFYLEYSNETWNWAFQQSHDIYNMASAEVQAGNSPLNYDGTTNTYYWGWRYPAERMVGISKIFRSVFGDSAMITRVRPLLEWQYNNLNSTAALLLDFLNTYYNNGDSQQHVSDPHPPSYYIWGAGGAVYYNSNNDSASTVDGIYASGIPSNGYQQVLNNEAAWARMYGLHVMAYEGGFAVGGDNANAVQQAARFDPRAKQSMIDSFNDFAAAGGDLYTAGTYTQWHDVPSAPSAPLVQAAATVNADSYNPPAIAQGVAISNSGTTTIPAKNYDTNDQYTVGGVSTNNVGFTAGYLIRTDNASYQIALNVGNTADGGKINVFVDGNLLGTVSVPNTGSMSTHQLVTAGTVTLSAGLHGVMIRGAAAPSGGNAGDLDSVQITYGQSSGGGGQGWTKCSDEGGTCSFSGTMVVRYGANGHYYYQTATNSIGCNNSVFGDPIVGTFKACYTQSVPPSGWTKCSDENGTCSFSGTATVAYGANGKFVYRTVTSSTACNNATFGDPNVGTFKACYYS